MTVKSGTVSINDDHAASAYAPLAIFNKYLSKFRITVFVLLSSRLAHSCTACEAKREKRRRYEHH